jgi:hypothetical protein
VNKNTTTTTIRIADSTLDVLDEWASVYEITRADVVRCVLGYFATLQAPTDRTSMANDTAYKSIVSRMQVLSESQ